MDREMTVADLVSALRSEIASRQALLTELESRLGPTEAPAPKPIGRRGNGVAEAVETVLREVGRPMHGLHEIVPALKARGLPTGCMGAFASTVLRTGKIVRTAPGTFALNSGE